MYQSPSQQTFQISPPFVHHVGGSLYFDQFCYINIDGSDIITYLKDLCVVGNFLHKNITISQTPSTAIKFSNQTLIDQRWVTITGYQNNKKFVLFSGYRMSNRFYYLLREVCYSSPPAPNSFEWYFTFKRFS